jgi:hypothetical protein
MCENMLVSLGFNRRQVKMGIQLQKALQQPVTCAAIAMVIQKTPRSCTKQVQASSIFVAFVTLFIYCLPQINMFRWAWVPGHIFQEVVKIDILAVQCFATDNQCPTPPLVYVDAAVAVPLMQPNLQPHWFSLSPVLLSPNRYSFTFPEQNRTLPGTGWYTRLGTAPLPLLHAASAVAAPLDRTAMRPHWFGGFSPVLSSPKLVILSLSPNKRIARIVDRSGKRILASPEGHLHRRT